MSVGVSRFHADDGPRYGLRDLFTPLETLLAAGGDPRLALDPRDGLNAYACAPQPTPEIWNFASSTASSISQAAYERAALAREELVHKSLFDEVEVAFDARLEDMRDELRTHLQLSPRVDVVFSPSGTDAQLYSLFLARAVLGAPPVTVVVGSDQTGSGTAFTSRGRHFSSVTASGVSVRKDGPIAGLGGDSIALPLTDEADADSAVLRAIETVVAQGAPVLLQIMDSSKFGWRAPSEACLDEIAKRWPGKVQIAVDACQMRLGRRRLRFYLDRGYMVLVTGSKFFGGPAFSGALLVPKGFVRALDRLNEIAPGFLDYASRFDWPKGWNGLRSRFERRPNFGQWLRWEAALAEIASYYALPGAFRAKALGELRAGVDDMIALTPSLGAIASIAHRSGVDDEEFVHDTIFPVMLLRDGRPVSIADTNAVYRALARDLNDDGVGSAADRQVAAQRYLVGQPVRLVRPDGTQAAPLRLCIGAQLVTGAWSADAAQAQRNLQHVLDRIADVLAKIELLLGRTNSAASASGA
ncbi:hypothetical protein NLM33_44485 [Bradyrhizobium sp. CCGUVB1N3]|uniref:hypothetical protein n=1 Tax=Bradyrhizobium sp. CCGUVB1N3 TaxID=2949629 RepID=UPI0020B34FC3|nr:hypothetical protein [Bradyrhizobium sp. CCGUVB1N3]MCP3477221.1 hypothetical protein [Bradyrhizobium sp. CCGUVB1N3]